MKYSRLTKILAGICFCNNSVDCKIPCHECYYKKVFDRLVELEDKIENGTLIELPFKLGDRVYFINGGSVEEALVNEISLYQDNNALVYLAQPENYLRVRNKEKIFKTIEEAKEKLKELLEEVEE